MERRRSIGVDPTDTGWGSDAFQAGKDRLLEICFLRGVLEDGFGWCRAEGKEGGILLPVGIFGAGRPGSFGCFGLGPSARWVRTPRCFCGRRMKFRNIGISFRIGSRGIATFL